MTTTQLRPAAATATVEAAPDGRGHAVTVRGAARRYGSVHALQGVDLDIDPGGFLVLLGPSGSGKSTLLRGLAGVERFDSGSVRFGDRIVSDGRYHLPPEKRGIAMVFQDYALWPHMTVRQNVSYALRRGSYQAADVRRRALEAIESVGLDGKEDRYPHELSGGQQQRVALARALAGRPRLILFDEPLSNLDADLRERLRVEIATLTRSTGATAVYITHDQSEAMALADRIGLLNSGRLEQSATPEELYRHPATGFAARFTGVAGSARGIVRERRDGATVVLAGDHILVAASGEAGLEPGDDVEVLVRPTATTFVDDASGLAGDRTLPAVVVDVAYRGRGYEHVVETPVGRITGVFAVAARQRGEQARVAIDPAECHVFTHNVTSAN
jgi:iron(III) transport system ATP-binding protein